MVSSSYRLPAQLFLPAPPPQAKVPAATPFPILPAGGSPAVSLSRLPTPPQPGTEGQPGQFTNKAKAGETLRELLCREAGLPHIWKRAQVPEFCLWTGNGLPRNPAWKPFTKKAEQTPPLKLLLAISCFLTLSIPPSFNSQPWFYMSLN